MSIFTKILKAGTAQVAPVSLPSDWLPETEKMKRVILHWTAGSYISSALDRSHYHFVIEGDTSILRGEHSILDNESVAGKTSDEYAAHTLGCNTGSIGISLCGSVGATENPFRPGSAPIKEAQWQRAAELVAVLCKRYKIPVTPETVLTHAEVQTNLRVQQKGKWDIAKLTFGNNLTTARACGDDFRARVRAHLEKI